MYVDPRDLWQLGSQVAFQLACEARRLANADRTGKLGMKAEMQSLVGLSFNHHVMQIAEGPIPGGSRMHSFHEPRGVSAGCDVDVEVQCRHTLLHCFEPTLGELDWALERAGLI
jgi:hypothetical protein